MENKKLSFQLTFTEAFEMGVKNAPSILGCIVLFLLTCWIPYLNIGTMIAITLLPTQLAKGEIINPLSIFDSKYRRYMGEFLLTNGLMAIGRLLALFFVFVPAIVIAIAWSLAIFYLIENGKNPIEAIKASNDATYGSKWMIFLVNLVFFVAVYIVLFLVAAIFKSGFFFSLLILVLLIVVLSINVAIRASIWKQLKDNVK